MRPVSKVEAAGRQVSIRCPVAAPAPVSTLWVAWNEHRRTTGLCAAWNVPLEVVRSNRNGAMRWVDQAIKTLRLLRRARPRILFVQNPSLVSTVVATLLRPVFGYYLVVDAHNEGVRPFARRGMLIGWLTRRLLRRADITIVTNSALSRVVTAAGGRALVLPDRLPEPVLSKRVDQKARRPIVAVISSFMSDEPVAEIIAAASGLQQLHFLFTGDSRRFPLDESELPDNVELTGYLANEAFWMLLSRAAVICDLTLKPDCLVCGAYEGLALGKPMVLSDDPSTRELFGPAAVLTNNEAEDIRRAVCTAIEDREQLRAKAIELREAYSAPWQEKAAAAWDTICAGVTVTHRGLI